MKEVDTRGLACPQPVLKTKEALARVATGDRVRVLVDNRAATYLKSAPLVIKRRLRLGKTALS